MRYIYLAGPIAGCTMGEAVDWREAVKERFNPYIRGISPLRCEPPIEGKYEVGANDDPKFGTAKAINAKNRLDTKNADLVLAFLPKELSDRRPSIGTHFEIAWAIEMDKPIIVVTDDEYFAEHPLVKDNVPWVLPTLDEAIEVINGLFTDYERVDLGDVIVVGTMLEEEAQKKQVEAEDQQSLALA